MPAPYPHIVIAILPGRRVCVAAALCLILLGSTAFATEVWVITDRHHAVHATPGARVIELDRPARIEAQITAGLPAHAEQAAAQMRQRLRAGGDTLQRRLREAYQGVADAWGLGITQIPAVVVDRRYVVYGESDVARALARIDAYRRARP